MSSKLIDAMNPSRAMELLATWGAPAHLLRHAELVGEVASDLAHQLRVRGVHIDPDWVQCAAILHDAGKIIHPEELHQSGHLHEEAGRVLLREKGLSEELARVCVSHAKWAKMSCSLEELVVALADTLWKGKRREALEERITEELARHLDEGPWEVFVWFADMCEACAAQGDARLVASRG